jgi:hypothetical protein
LIATPWPGWKRILLLGSGTTVAWHVAGVWLPVVLAIVFEPTHDGPITALSAMLVAVGVGGTVLLAGLMPLIAAGFSTSWRTRGSRPGHWRVLAVTGVVGVMGVLAVLGAVGLVAALVTVLAGSPRW